MLAPLCLRGDPSLFHGATASQVHHPSVEPHRFAPQLLQTQEHRCRCKATLVTLARNTHTTRCHLRLCRWPPHIVQHTARSTRCAARTGPFGVLGHTAYSEFAKTVDSATSMFARTALESSEVSDRLWCCAVSGILGGTGRSGTHECTVSRFHSVFVGLHTEDVVHLCKRKKITERGRGRIRGSTLVAERVTARSTV